MRRRASFSLTLVGVWGLSTLSVIADDADRCVNATGRDGIAACDHVIASGKIGGSGLAFAYYNRGLAKLKMGDYDRAITDFDASIRLDPASAATFNNRGSAWYAKGDPDRALADFDKATQLDPAYAFAYHNRGEVWKDKGDFNRAIADYGKAVDLDRTYTAAYTDRALAYERIGDVTRAKEDFRAALAMSAKYSDGQRAQATARERLAALARAEQRPPTGAITGAPAVAQRDRPAALVVNGEAITDDDIDRRTKFNALANHKSPSRKDVIEELIDDKLKAWIARRYKIVLTDKDIDAQYADMAKRMHTTADELTQLLGANGVGDKTLKAKILADLSWQYVIRGRFGPDQAGEKNVNKGDPNVDYIYTLQPVLFQVPPGNPASLEAHKGDAEALLARFTNCDSGLAAARAQHDVVVRAPITKNSFELPYALREILANTELGHLTPPETMSEGVQLFAVCARKENMFRQRSEAFLRELRLHADISDVREDIRGEISKDRFPAHPPANAQQLDELAALDKRVGELRQAGNFSEAIPLARRALAICEKECPDQYSVAAEYNILATLYGTLGRDADAEPLYKQALAILEKALGPHHPEVAKSLHNLAFLYYNQGRYPDAEPLYRRALAIREKALGPDHPDVAQSLNNLAANYDYQGRYADAEPLYKRALAIREKALGPDHPDVAQSCNNLATLYLDQSHYADAQPLVRRALAIREKTLGPDHPDVAQSLNSLAGLYRLQGTYADAEPLYKRALAISEKALGPGHFNVGQLLNNLAALYRSQGRYGDAEPLYKRSLAILEKALGPDHPDVAAPLDNLATVYKNQGRYGDAELLYKRALAIREKALGPDHPDVATSLNNLGTLYADQGRYADAEPLYKRSLAVLEKALGPDYPNVAQSLNNLANLYRAQGRYADALPLVQTTIGHGRAAANVALPVLLAAQGNGLMPAGKARDDALNVAQRASQSAAAAAVNKLGARLAAGSGRLASLVRNDQDLAAEAENLDEAILAAVSKEPAKRDAAAEQRTRDRQAEIAKQRAALQGIFAAEFPDYAALSNPQPLTVKEIQALLSDGEVLLLYAASDKASYVFAVTRTSAAWKPIALGMAALSEKVAAFRRGLDVEALRQSAAGGKPVLFDLGLANDLYVSLVGPVDDLIKDAHHVLVVPSGPLTSLPFHLLVTEKPAVAIPQLKDVGSYRDAAWLIKRQAVNVLPALASLKALRGVARQDPGAKPLVGFGDPVFDPAERARALAERRAARTRVALTTGYGDFWQGAGIDRAKLAKYLPSLLDTADELKEVAGKLGAAPGDVHLGTDANEAVVKRMALADYRVVYFATHGLVAGDVAGLGEPSLALTLPKQPTELDDGLLTASEVAQLKLNADWVVLSACNTAAADKPGAEALSGLARAFFYAGARALLVSHWSVDSEAASRLTTSTFAIMKADPKLGRAAALRNAMLTYMNDRGSPLNAYPAFWGPFSIIGEGAAR